MYVCEKPTKRHPEGRRGTEAGYRRHLYKKETPCEECMEAQREYNAARMRKNYGRYRDKKLEYQKSYREENKEKLRLSDRIYYLNNKAKREAQKRVRELRLEELPFEAFAPEDISKAHGEDCYLCGDPVDLLEETGWSTSPHLDHVHPISDEATPGHVLSNVRWTHARCNMSKGAKLIEELDLPFDSPVKERYGANEESEVLI